MRDTGLAAGLAGFSFSFSFSFSLPFSLSTTGSSCAFIVPCLVLRLALARCKDWLPDLLLYFCPLQHKSAFEEFFLLWNEGGKRQASRILFVNLSHIGDSNREAFSSLLLYEY